MDVVCRCNTKEWHLVIIFVKICLFRQVKNDIFKGFGKIDLNIVTTVLFIVMYCDQELVQNEIVSKSLEALLRGVICRPEILSFASDEPLFSERILLVLRWSST